MARKQLVETPEGHEVRVIAKSWVTEDSYAILALCECDHRISVVSWSEDAAKKILRTKCIRHWRYLKLVPERAYRQVTSADLLVTGNRE